MLFPAARRQNEDFWSSEPSKTNFQQYYDPNEKIQWQVFICVLMLKLENPSACLVVSDAQPTQTQRKICSDGNVQNEFRRFYVSLISMLVKRSVRTYNKCCVGINGTYERKRCMRPNLLPIQIAVSFETFSFCVQWSIHVSVNATHQ